MFWLGVSRGVLYEGTARHERHREVGLPIAIAHLVNRYDVRMTKLCGGLGFFQKATPSARGCNFTIADAFERHEALNPPNLTGLVDDAHASFPELFE